MARLVLLVPLLVELVILPLLQQCVEALVKCLDQSLRGVEAKGKVERAVFEIHVQAYLKKIRFNLVSPHYGLPLGFRG